MHTDSLPPHQQSVYLQRIEALERALKHAQYLRYQDELTPILNRRGFRRAWDQWPASQLTGTRMCCAMMDLDDFKSITDQYGHPAGDIALIHFAQTLRLHILGKDIVALLGGYEFALVLHNGSGIDTLGGLEPASKYTGSIPSPSPRMISALAFLEALARAYAALLDVKQSGKALDRLQGQRPWSSMPPSAAMM